MSGQSGLHGHEEVTDNYTHSGWNTRQTMFVIGTMGAAIAALIALGVSELKKKNTDIRSDTLEKYEPGYTSDSEK